MITSGLTVRRPRRPRLGGTRRVWPVGRFLVAMGVLLAAFCLLLWQVTSSSPVTSLDNRIRTHVLVESASSSWQWTLPWAHAFSNAGSAVPAIPALVVIAALMCVLTRSLRPALAAVAALAMLAAVVVPLKLFVARPGPGYATLPAWHLGYYPSGHTADAVMCYGTAALIVGNACRPLLRHLVHALAVILVALVGVSLVWSDYHWSSDVVGSICLCGAALIGMVISPVSPITVRQDD